MQPLSDRARRRCSLLAFTSLVAGIATLPLSVRSAAHPTSASPSVIGVRAAQALATPVPIRRNPFQSDIAVEHAAPQRLANADNVMPTRMMGAQDALPIVSAIAIGEHPSAVFEENGESRIHTIGDRIGTHAIVAISLGGVRLDDGTLLVISGGANPGAPADPTSAVPIGAQPFPDVREGSR